MDVQSPRSMSDDDGTIISDTELSDLSESIQTQKPVICLQPLNNRDVTSEEQGKLFPEFEWISSKDKSGCPKVLSSQKRHHDNWNDDECMETKSQKSRRIVYSFEDKKAILEYISETKSYNKVKGKKLWETMVDCKICPGHTWQSLREHYMKQIIPNICIFRLPKSTEKLFLRPFPEYQPKKHVTFREKISETFVIGGENHPLQQLQLGSSRTTHHHNKEYSDSPLGDEESSCETSDDASEWLSSSHEKKIPEESREMLDETNASCAESTLASDRQLGVDERVLREQSTSNHHGIEDSLILLISKDGFEKEETENSSGVENISVIGRQLQNRRENIEESASNQHEYNSSLISPITGKIAEEGNEGNTSGAENTLVTNKGLNVEEHSEAESASNLHGSDENNVILPCLETSAKRGRDTNVPDVEDTQVAARQLNEESILNDLYDIESVQSSDEDNLILPIRKCIGSKASSSVKQNEQQSSSSPSRTPSPKNGLVLKAPALKPRATASAARKDPLPEETPGRKRREYSFEDKKIIVNYISHTKAYNKVKGKKFWQEMAKSKVLPGRTWQSLKEHYHKKIVHNLFIFRLPDEEIGRLLAPFMKPKRQFRVPQIL